ncbi:aldehyde dehydrogenase family protein [Tomitella gaofuii]|uniref:aldehyde dehydrogenase family protein n=1 Tax=Tomitella gaofuii TaxID=2760083 RepID=UPI0015F9F8EB|nr:aldehyde dehydrogenase family protein [Tomitella gaofuii]
MTQTEHRQRTDDAAAQVETTAQVEAAAEAARSAARWWDVQGFRGRRGWLRDFARVLARGVDELAGVIARETGKPDDDALLEVMLAVEHLDWASRNAKRVLRRRSVPSGVVGIDQAASVGYRPYGVVGVIGPWNYPLYTPMGSIAYALAAGNAVVFKPSELTPGVGEWLARAWQSLAPPQPVLQVVTGDGAVGAALCRAGVDKVAFTGSTATAKRVMATCAESLTPLVAECGGKDAMLVAADADLDAAAEYAVFGGLGNAGQTCAGVERIYVADGVFDEFVAAVTARVRAVRAGTDYGPMTMPAQAEIVRAQIADALRGGGRALVGGEDSARGRTIEPVVLTGVAPDSTAVTDETFGPVLVIEPVADLDEGVRRANASRYGLGASVFTADADAGRAVADRLDCGVVTVNSVLGFAGVPALPFGGTGDSGFGRIHGDDGLREFATVKSMTVTRFATPLKLMTMRRRRRDVRVARLMLRLRHGR